MWLQLSQIKKKFTEGNRRKPAFIYYADVTKIRKIRACIIRSDIKEKPF